MPSFVRAPSPVLALLIFAFAFILASAPLSAQTPGYAVSASPSVIFPCGRITVQWSAPAGHPTAYLRLYQVGGSSYFWSNAIGTGVSGTFILDAQWLPNTYEIRLYVGSQLQVTSNPFTIQGDGRCPPTVVASPGEVGTLDPLNVRWEDLPSSSVWIGLYRVGAGPRSYSAYILISSRSGTWSVPAPATG